jgi:hypothetical protein
MNLNRKWALASVLALATAAGIAAVGCGDDSTATAAKDAGGKDSGGNTVDGSTFDTDSGTVDTDSGATTLYQRLGGHDGIAAAVKHIVEDADGVGADPQLLSYFAVRTGGVATTGFSGGSPSLAVIEDCFTNFTAKAVGGTEPYPFMSMATGAPAGGFMCRDMATTHAGLGITSAAFQKFVSIAGAKLTMLGVSSADLQSIGGALLGTAADIVSQSRTQEQMEAGGFDAATAAANYAVQCSTVNPDGGYDAGPAGKNCILY